jgi:hypothetical protein
MRSKGPAQESVLRFFLFPLWMSPPNTAYCLHASTRIPPTWSHTDGHVRLYHRQSLEVVIGVGVRRTPRGADSSERGREGAE